MEGFENLPEETSCTWRNRLGFDFLAESHPVFQDLKCQAPNNSMHAGSGDYFLSSIFKFLMGIIFTFILLPLTKQRASPIEANPVQEPEKDLSPPSPNAAEHSSKDEDEVDSPRREGQSLLMCQIMPSLTPVEEETKISEELNNNHKDHDNEETVVDLTPKEPEILRKAKNSDLEELQGESIWMEDLTTGGYTRRENLSEAVTELCQHLGLDLNQCAFLNLDEALNASMES